jgi:hypothetical protein
MFIYLRLNNITTTTKGWLSKRKVTHLSQGIFKIYQKDGQPMIHHITTVVSSSSRNIPNT